MPIIRTNARHLALLPVLLLVACVGSMRTAQSRQDPRVLLDSYLMARGMALGYGLSGRAGPNEIMQLVAYDRTALNAIAAALKQPGSVRTAQARAAVETMMVYTSDQDLAGRPAADALLR